MNDDREFSVDFEAVFCGMGFGSPAIECACGRLVFSDSRDYEPGELDSYKAAMEKRPERHVYLQGDDGVSGIELGGRTVVHGCKCNLLGTFEKLVWAERRRVVQYLRRRTLTEIEKLKEKVAEHRQLMEDMLPVYGETGMGDAESEE